MVIGRHALDMQGTRWLRGGFGAPAGGIAARSEMRMRRRVM